MRGVFNALTREAGVLPEFPHCFWHNDARSRIARAFHNLPY